MSSGSPVREGAGPFVPGASDTDWGPVVIACDDLVADLEAQDDQCSEILEMVDTLHVSGTDECVAKT